MRHPICLLIISIFFLPQLVLAEGLNFGTLDATPMMVEKIVLDENDSLPLMYGESTTLEAITFPEGQEVQWKIEAASDSEADVSSTVNSDNTVTITALSESGDGYVNVEASIGGGVATTGQIYVGCLTCTEGICNMAATGAIDIGSVDIRISLGKAEEGMGAGDLYIKEETPSVELFTPALLQVSTFSETVQPIYLDGILKQVDTPQSLVIIEPDSDYSYEILFFSKQDVGELEDGLYRVKPFAEPFAIWRLENPHSAPDQINDILVTEFRGGAEKRYEYKYSESENTWSLASGNGLRLKSRRKYTNADGNRVERTIVSGGDGIPVSVTEQVFHDFEWGEELISEIIDPDGDKLTTTYSYYENKGNGFSKKASRIDSNGSWTRYEYDDEGRTIKVITPWMDAPFDAEENDAKVIVKDYTSLPGDAGDKKDFFKPRTESTYINGTLTSKTFFNYQYNENNERIEVAERCRYQDCSFGDPDNLRTTSVFYEKSDGPESKKLKSLQNPDGTVRSYLYEAGVFSSSPDPEKAEFTPGEGTALRKTTINGTLKHPHGIAYHSTKETSITDWLGNNVMQEQFVKTDTGYERVSWSFNTYNKLGRIIETLNSNRTRGENSWSGCCGKASTTDINGITTRFGYDELKRITTRINEATGLATEFIYDAEGRQLEVQESNEGLSKVSTNRYDISGRLVKSIDPAGLVTEYSYDDNVTTVLRPGGIDEITTMYPDGRIQSITGSAVIDRYYEYGINQDGSQWTKVSFARKDSPRWEKTTRDLLGRIFKTEKPGYLLPQITENHYNQKGQLAKTSATGQLDTLFEYDEHGKQFRSGIDVDANGQLDLASMDRIHDTRWEYKKIDDDWWNHQENVIFAEDNDDKPTVVSVNRSRLSGWNDGVVAEQVSSDILGNKTTSIETLDRYNRIRFRSTKYPDSEIPAEQLFSSNQLLSAQSKTGIVTQYIYDSLNRRTATINPRTGATKNHYNENHRLNYIEDPSGNRTTFEYNPETGLKTAEINAVGKLSRFAYNNHGQLIRTWGDVPYPVEYQYNEYGEKVKMFTFRGDEEWSQPTWPENAVGDQTEWFYQESTGLLVGKRDAKDYGTDYRYDDANRLSSRKWARGVTTEYSYTDAGDLLKVNYSDDTPGLSFDYDRLGRKKTVSDAIGTRVFLYNDSLQLISEAIGNDPAATINRGYDSLGRNSGFNLADYRIDYGYDSNGRFKTLNWQVKGQTASVAYDYLENSDLLSGYSSDNVSVKYHYEQKRDLKTAVINKSHEKLISKYEYQYDRLGRRINVKNSGQAFDENAFSLYGYNARNEVHTSSRYIGGNLTDQTTPVQDEERLYTYDPIGNRDKTYEASIPKVFKVNEINQYDSIEAKPFQILAYDHDGNLTNLQQDSENTKFHYNGENRLARIEPVTPKEGDTRSEYLYDYMGRRSEKKVLSFLSGQWQLKSQSGYLYDGWNLIAEIDKINNSSVNYVWGLDLSQSLQGAGGVGGLLLRVEQAQAYSYLFDANGNVGQLFDGNDLAASYEYDPFGNTVNQSGKLADSNPIRFSTKYFDEKSRLYYYGYRFYAPEMGRWINRDPIQERGGGNLYSFSFNDSINWADILGLTCVRLLIHTTSLAKSDEYTFENAANNLSSEYKSKNNAINVLVVKASTGQEIISKINEQEKNNIISLDVFSHSNLAGVHIAKKLQTPEKSPWPKRNIHRLVRENISESEAEYMEESYHGLYTDKLSAIGVGIYYNQKAGDGVAYLDEINFDRFTKNATIEFHGCKTAQEIKVSNLITIDNFAMESSVELYDAGKTESTVIGHVYRSSPTSNNDYRQGLRRVYQNGEVVQEIK